MEDKVIHITTIPIKKLMLMKAEEDGHFLDEGTVETNYLKDPDCFFVATHELEPYCDEPPLLLKRHTNYVIIMTLLTQMRRNFSQ
jgi:hypothetical protein